MDNQENPITDAGPVTDARPITETPVANDADIVAPQPAQQRRPARRNANKLYIQSSTAAEQEFDEALGRIRHHGAVRREVGDWKELERTLGGFERIGTLVLMTHSAPGTLLIGGEPKSGADAAAVLRGTGARANAIVFEGCMIMREPVEAAQIAQGLGATTAVGYDWWHYVGKRAWDLDQKPADQAYRAELAAWARDNAKYLMQPIGKGGPRQPATGPAIVAALEKNPPTTLPLYLEWFHPSAGGPGTPDPQQHPARNNLKRMQISSRKQADDFAAINHVAQEPHEVTLAVRRVLR
jgi:hypothetical protein